jgi:hypothetical protein
MSGPSIYRRAHKTDLAYALQDLQDHRDPLGRLDPVALPVLRGQVVLQVPWAQRVSY